MNMFIEFDGSCPYCGGEINIIENMMYNYSIDNNGVPNNLFEEKYITQAYCTQCNNSMVAVAESDGDTVKYKVYPSEIGQYIYNYERKHNCFNDSRASVLSHLVMDKKVTPFSNVKLSEHQPFMHSRGIVDNEDDVPW